MFSACIFCNLALGTNEVIEHFPVGRRLAFDADRGRLWVVCRHCERWNLSPLEERWEAVESCERLFRATRIRVSTEHIGMAKHREGLELIRIGAPLRPEFAAWRYGDQFGRRRKRAILYGIGGAAALIAVNFTGIAAVGGSGLGGYWVWQMWEGIAGSRTQARLETDDGRVIKLRRDDLPSVRLRAAEQGPGFRLSVLKGKKQEWFDGAQAERFVGQIVPRMNRKGGTKSAVQTAVREIEDRGHPDDFLAHIVRGDRFQSRKGVPGYINKMPAPTRLALEMALHEEDERRALEGELDRLRGAWEEAERVAAIADSLLLPEGVESFLERHRSGGKDG